jgi:thioredoxin 1
VTARRADLGVRRRTRERSTCGFEKGLQMNSAIAQSDHILRLTETEIGSLLSTTSGMVVVEVATEWCFPCRLLRPVMRKLATEFASRMMLVVLDGDPSKLFNRVHHVDTFPQLFFFESGQLVGREVGFQGVDEIRAAIEKRLNVAGAETRSEAELSFCNDHAQATARLEEIMKPVSDALEPAISAIAPMMEAFEAALIEELVAGGLSQSEVVSRRKAERDRLYAPFEDKIAALRLAQNEALGVYEELMNEAVEKFETTSQLAGPTSPGIAFGCPPVQSFCLATVPNRDKAKS